MQRLRLHRGKGKSHNPPSKQVSSVSPHAVRFFLQPKMDLVPEVLTLTLPINDASGNGQMPNKLKQKLPFGEINDRKLKCYFTHTV